MSTELARILPFRSATAAHRQEEAVWTVITDNDRILSKTPVMNLERPAPTQRIGIDELYAGIPAIRPELATALRLLQDGLDHLNFAVEAVTNADQIGADDGIQRFEAMMPELLACRSLGNSFGAIINALINALRNRHGEFLTQPQMIALRTIMNETRDEPFMSFDRAVDAITKLEDAGFIVEPEAFEVIADWLDE
jgi:hypothetical protein